MDFSLQMSCRFCVWILYSSVRDSTLSQLLVVTGLWACIFIILPKVPWCYRIINIFNGNKNVVYIANNTGRYPQHIVDDDDL